MWASTDLAFSIVWPVAERPTVVYMSYTPPSSVAVRCVALNGSLVWALSGLATTGLNNNPNLDVGAVGGVLLYSKPQELVRNLTLLDPDTGAQVSIYLSMLLSGRCYVSALAVCSRLFFCSCGKRALKGLCPTTTPTLM